MEICVALMFTCSAQHAAVNFGQFETYKFIPNSPTCMRLPPHKKGEVCILTAYSLLAMVFTLVKLLSDIFPDLTHGISVKMFSLKCCY